MFYRKHSRVTAEVGTHSRTKQSHKDECDINNILNQYKRTGIITHVQNARPTYQDLPDDLDYQNALNTLYAAQDAFAALPATVRDHFQNDPEKFLAAFQDKEQHAKLEEFGLIGERKAPGAVRPPAPAPVSPAPEAT